MSSLQDLLPEMLDAIAAYLDQPSLAAMCRSCKSFMASCRPILYKRVAFDQPAQCWLFRNTAKKNGELGAMVQSITFDVGDYWADGEADEILPWLPNLRHLSFFARAMDFFSRAHDDDEDKVGLGLLWPGPEDRVPSSVPLAASRIGSWLPQLETCSLEFLDYIPEWDLERKAVLFLHPTLKSLNIHHAYHGCDILNPPDETSDIAEEYWRSPVFDADPGPRSTNLQTLRFHLSEIDPEALHKILSFPRSLQHFTLTHWDYLGSKQPEVRREPELIIVALMQQQHSLKSLDLQYLKASSAGISLHPFVRLRTLDIGFDTLFGGARQDSNTMILPTGPTCSHGLDKFLPSCLRSLILRYRISSNLLELNVRRVEILERVAADQKGSLPMLQNMCLIEEKPEGDGFVLASDARDEFEQRLEAVRRRLVSNGVRVVRENKVTPTDPYSRKLWRAMKKLGSSTYKNYDDSSP